MRRITLLAASALALALAAPAYAQTAAPDSGTKMERSAPADNPAATDKSQGPTAPDKGASSMPGTKADKSAAADKATTQTGGFITQQAESQKMAETMIGMKVQNPQKESVGKVSDLILDDQNRIVGAVVSVGGFLGIGDKHVGLAWNELQVQGSGSDQVATVNLTKDQLKSAPSFKTQADVKSEQEAERRKLEQPSKPGGGMSGGGMGGSSGGMGTSR
jgi:sporulation protein YlmC with PRC-barrel domain